MKKNYVYLFLLLLSCSFVVAQKVTLTPTTVNGAGFSTGPINLASTPNSTVSLGVKVEFPAGAAVGDQGTIKIYYSKGAALGANVAIGGDGGALYFGGAKVASRNFVINLNWNDFLTAGGHIYAEYKNNAAYKSSNISVIKNATMTGGTTLNPPADAPNPRDIANTLCCNQTIRQGDQPAPITGSQFLNPYKGLPYGINSQWINTRNGESPKFDDLNNVLHLDYSTELKNITVIRKLGYSYYNDFPNTSNEVTITVVPSPIKNEISVFEAGPNSDGFIEIIDSNPKEIGAEGMGREINLNILQNPYHIAQRGDGLDSAERYEWQYARTQPGPYQSIPNWITIENENSSSLKYFTPKKYSETGDNYFLVRRIIHYKGIKRVSNFLKIIPRELNSSNLICCDQNLPINSSLKEIDKPSIITGSTPSVENLKLDSQSSQILDINYQWQSQSIANTRPNTYGTWTDILSATQKDYLPNPLQLIVNGDRFEVPTTYKYRRIAKIRYLTRINDIQKDLTVTSYSNEIHIKSGREYGRSTLVAYPNPANSIVNIENKDVSFTLSNAKINIVNTMGTIVNSNNFSIINPNLLSIDVSNLVNGIYFINIEIGAGRRGGGTSQLTFIKSN